DLERAVMRLERPRGQGIEPVARPRAGAAPHQDARLVVGDGDDDRGEIDHCGRAVQGFRRSRGGRPRHGMVLPPRPSQRSLSDTTYSTRMLAATTGRIALRLPYRFALSS